jgi:hypothetical protein
MHTLKIRCDKWKRKYFRFAWEMNTPWLDFSMHWWPEAWCWWGCVAESTNIYIYYTYSTSAHAARIGHHRRLQQLSPSIRSMHAYEVYTIDWHLGEWLEDTFFNVHNWAPAQLLPDHWHDFVMGENFDKPTYSLRSTMSVILTFQKVKGTASARTSGSGR